MIQQLATLLAKVKRTTLTLLVALVAIVVVGMIMRSCANEKESIRDQALSDSLKGLNNNLHQEISFWKDKYNQEHLVASKVEATKEEMAAYSEPIAKQLNIKPKQVEAITKGESSFTFGEELKTDTVYLDSSKIKQINFNWQDNYVKVNGSVGAVDSVFVTAIDTVTIVDYWKRNWFLGQEHHFVDISNSNPYVKTTGGKSVQLSSKIKTWSVGPSLQLSYPISSGIDFKKPQITFGISIQKTLFRL